MPNGNGLTEGQICDIIHEAHLGQPSPTEINSLLYGTPWKYIAEAAKKCDTKYSNLGDFPAVLEKLPMSALEKYNIHYKRIEQNEKGESFTVRENLQKELGPIMRNAVQGIWTWNDADIMRKDHPRATPEQNARIGKFSDTFYNDALYARRNNDADFRAFIDSVEDATLPNIKKLYELGFDIHRYGGDDPIHYFHSPQGESTEAELNVIRGSLSFAKNIVNLGNVIEQARLEPAWLQDVIDGKMIPSRGEVNRLRVKLLPYVDIRPVPRLATDEWVIGVKRKYSEKESKDVVLGAPQLEYEWFYATMTNFPPLVRYVREMLEKRWEESQEAWKSEWGQPPSPII